MFLIHLVPAMFMTVETAKNLKISGAYMTITAFIPFARMFPREYGENAIMLSELRRFPAIKTVAGFAGQWKSGAHMIRALNTLIIFGMTGVTFRC